MKNLVIAAVIAAVSPVCISQVDQGNENSPTERTIIESNSVKALEAQKNTKSSKRATSVTISKRAGEEQQVHDEAYYLEEISKIDNHLNAIDQKVAHVNSVPSQKELATSNNWFGQMDEMKIKLNSKKTILQAKLEEIKSNH